MRATPTSVRGIFVSFLFYFESEILWLERERGDDDTKIIRETELRIAAMLILEGCRDGKELWSCRGDRVNTETALLGKVQFYGLPTDTEFLL